MPPQARPGSAITRAISALFGIVLLLAGHIPIAAFARTGNAMACCQNGRSCCRKLHKNAGGPTWQSQNCGMPQCGFGSGTGSVSYHVDAAPAPPRYQAATVRAEAAVPRNQSRLLQIPLALFQLPPPFPA